MKISKCLNPVSSCCFRTPVGQIQVIGCREGIHSLNLKQSVSIKQINHLKDHGIEVEPLEVDNAHLKSCINWLRNYFAGEEVATPPICYADMSKLHRSL